MNQEIDIYKFIEEQYSKLSKSVESLMDLINIWRLVGYGLLLLSFLDIVEAFVPPDFMNPAWEFQTLGVLVERVPVPLIGLVLVFYGKLERRFDWELVFLNLLSRIALLVGILYILLVPVGVVNTIRLKDTTSAQINNQYNQQLSQANQIEQQLNNATPEQLNRFIAVQGGSLNGKKPEELKSKLLTEFSTAKEKIKTQADEARFAERVKLLKSSAKWNLGALISGFLFISFWKGTLWARVGK
jgi:hypothetical protein